MSAIICRTCGEPKAHDDFYRRNTKLGRATECKTCTKKRASDWYYANHDRATTRNREYHHRNRDRSAARHRRRLYGITPEEVEELVFQQDDRCAICREDRPLVVDHCHGTGIVRALLCNRCNSAIGYFEEDPALMRRAADYVVHHQELIAEHTAPLPPDVLTSDRA